ncbi:MAG: phosphatase PAP2 family protein [Methylophilus sp.]
MAKKIQEIHAETPWLKHVKVAFTRHIFLKTLGLTLFISLFFIAYFHILKNPVYPTTLIPLTFVDKLISFQPLALPLYLSLWIYVAAPPALIASRRELYEFTTAILLMCIAGLIIFYFWPTTIAPADINWDLYPSISFLKNIDAAGNACPSLHVATAFFSGMWISRILTRIKSPNWIKLLNIIWCAGIIYSTLATRQHVALDVAAGLLLGSIAILLTSVTFWKK